jgi:CIC family chloride channel protein
MELILRDFAAQAFGMVVLSSVTASVIGRAALGNQPFLELPAFGVHNAYQYALFAALGPLAGGVGVAFTTVLYRVEDACDWAWARTRGPEWARPAAGGLLLGGVLLALPQMYGVGYPVLGGSIAGHYTATFLLILLAGKIVATSLTIGIGGSGGVFAPSLFMGAMVGCAYGQVLHDVAPGLTGPSGAYGLIGMGAVFAGAARAPITAVVIMFELTGEYSIIVPLMAAIVLATMLSRLLMPDTIYTLKLRRRGIDLGFEHTAGALATTAVDAVMEPVAGALDERTSMIEAAEQLSRADHGQLPVVDPAGRYRGIVTARAIADALADGRHDDVAIVAVTELPPVVRTDDRLQDTLDALENARGPVPVVDSTASNLVGWLTHQDVLAALRPQRER